MKVLMGRFVVALGLMAALAATAGGCGSSGVSSTIKAGQGSAGAGRLAVADLLTNLAHARAAGDICLKPGALRRNGGALASTVRAELRRAEDAAKSLVEDRLKQVARAAERGIAQAARNPDLLINGHVPGFEKAAGLAGRYGLSTC